MDGLQQKSWSIEALVLSRPQSLLRNTVRDWFYRNWGPLTIGGGGGKISILEPDTDVPVEDEARHYSIGTCDGEASVNKGREFKDHFAVVSSTV